MNDSIFQWFQKRCQELGIEIVDYRYYCNECDLYELKSTEDMKVMSDELLKKAFEEEFGFKIEIKNTEDTHLILLYEPED